MGRTKKYFNRKYNRDSVTAIIDESNYLRNLGRIDDAIELLKSEAAYTSNEHLIYELAKIYISISKYAEALEELLKIEDAKTIRPFLIYTYIAKCYFFTNNFELSYDYYVKTYECDSKKSDQSLSYILSSARKVNKALEGLEFIKKHSKIKDEETHLEVLFTYNYLSMYEKAISYINDNQLSPHNHSQNLLFAQLYIGVGDLGKADSYLRRCSNIEDPYYVLTKSILAFKNFEYDTCVELLNGLIDNENLVESAYFWLVRVYLRTANLKEVQKILDLNCLSSSDQNIFQATMDMYGKNYDHARMFLESEIQKNSVRKFDALFNLAVMDIRTGNYKDALKIADEIYESFSYKLGRDFKILLLRIVIIAKTNLGIKACGDGYYINQVIKYSKEKAIEHISDHFESIDGGTKFMSDMNLEDTYDYIQHIINDLDPNYLCEKSPNDVYLLDFKNAGIIGNTILNKMQVITIAGTKKIVTFYPVNKLSFTLENEKDVAQKNVPVKRLSQIEKFNQRYNKK